MTGKRRNAKQGTSKLAEGAVASNVTAVQGLGFGRVTTENMMEAMHRT